MATWESMEDDHPEKVQAFLDAAASSAGVAASRTGVLPLVGEEMVVRQDAAPTPTPLNTVLLLDLMASEGVSEDQVWARGTTRNIEADIVKSEWPVGNTHRIN